MAHRRSHLGTYFVLHTIFLLLDQHHQRRWRHLWYLDLWDDCFYVASNRGTQQDDDSPEVLRHHGLAFLWLLLLRELLPLDLHNRQLVRFRQIALHLLPIMDRSLVLLDRFPFSDGMIPHWLPLWDRWPTCIDRSKRFPEKVGLEWTWNSIKGIWRGVWSSC